ncbi:MAG: hypothetical protein KTQ49_08030 [Candidatus Omnitrophica bacterium]|nr:hypothetical protein [Candidatus Omnitrophota bacterium]
MSIVYEYLKQIQQQKEPGTFVPLEKVAEQNGKWWPPLPALGVWVLTGVVVLGSVFWMVSRSGDSGPRGALSSRVRPFARAASVTTPGYVLEGIIYNPDQPFAIVNGKMLERNGQIDDLVVTAITPSAVSLKHLKDQTDLTLKL